MRAEHPSRQLVRLPVHEPCGIMTGQAELRSRTIAHQELGQLLVDVLELLLVTGRTLDRAVDHSHSWVCRLRWILLQQLTQVRCVRDRSL